MSAIPWSCYTPGDEARCVTGPGDEVRWAGGGVQGICCDIPNGVLLLLGVCYE